MSSTIHHRAGAALALGVFATMTAVSACAGPGDAPAATAAPVTAAASTAGAASSAPTAFRDGTYTERGGYQSPGGPESVSVTLGVAQGLVTAVKVVGSGGTPNAQHYQSAFASGVSGAVVGKPLAGLSVGATSGSSLTPKGFDAALDKIRADAA